MGKKRRGKIHLSNEIRMQLEQIVNKRTDPASRVRRAGIILGYGNEMTIAELARQFNTNRALIERCIDKALEIGAIAGLDDLPRSGRPALITDDAKSWVLNLACTKPGDFGYAAETWTYRALIAHVKKNCTGAGHDCLKNIGKGLLGQILSVGNIRPHKITYYLERRDPEFEAKQANVLHVYKEVEMVNSGTLDQQKQTTLSYDEKPGIQAIRNIAAQLLPTVGKHAGIGRDYEYKRLGTVSLLAGIDLHSGKVIPLVRDRHRSKEFVEFLKQVDAEYSGDWKIRIILDNHSSHISKETQKYLDSVPNRFEFVFTPKHGSWLNMIEMFFSKIARGFLRHIRVESKEELITRILKGIEEINQEPVVFRWKYKMDEVSLT